MGGPMSERFVTATVGDIVANDFRAAGVFERYGIDFCCARRTPADACRTALADPAAVVRELEALPTAGGDDVGVADWPVDLIDHIESVHHRYVRAALPRIARYLAKLVDTHGRRHPELVQTAARFDLVSNGLEQHTLKEEQVLFPFVRDLAEHADRDRKSVV